MPSSPLSIRDVRRHFGTVKALDGVSLEIHTAEFFSLLGPSGCGKTTLLRILAGLDEPDSGSIQLDGKDLAAMPAHQRPINTVFQSYALFPHLTVRDNIGFGLRMKKTGAAETNRRVNAMMDLVEVSALAARKPSELSGGQRQRVAVARALVNEPQVLLLDEPLAAVNQKLRKQLQADLHALQRRLGLTFIYVTHDQEEALSLSDRLAVMNHGRIEQIGRPQEVYDQPANRFVAEFLGDCNLIESSALPQLSAKPGTIFFRPEQVQILETPAENTIAGEVIETTFSGADHRLKIRCGDQIIKVTTRAPIKPGQRLWLRIPPESIRSL